MIYKLALVLLVFYDLKIWVVALSLINPVTMLAMDIWQFKRLVAIFKMPLDKLYLLLNLSADLILLMNAGFVLLLEVASEARADHPYLPYFDVLFNCYRLFLITFICLKFCALLVEILVNRIRTRNILKSEQYKNFLCRYEEYFLSH